MAQGLVLHHLEASRSIRVVWLLEYLEAPYELKLYPRDQQTKLAEAEPFSNKGLAAIHPMGRAPIVQDGPLTLAETGTIFRYLIVHHDSRNLYPKPSEKTQLALDQNMWIDFSEASVMLHLIPLNYLIKGKAQSKDGTSLQEKAIARGLSNDTIFVEKALEKNGGTLRGGGELGPADFANLFGIEYYKILITAQSQEWRDNLNLHVGPATEKWLEKCHADPKYKKACSLERDGKVTPERYLNFLIGKE